MDIQMSYIVAPFLGGVIGYITNDIAIRMLFHPHKAKYIMGWHVPFTPGIIPKEKGRIAEAIGGVISENLMNKEVLEKYLLSEDMIGKLREAVKDFINTQNGMERQSVNSCVIICQKKRLPLYPTVSMRVSRSRLIANCQTLPWAIR